MSYNMGTGFDASDPSGGIITYDQIYSRVGVNQSVPQYDLDVGGTVNALNLLSTNATISGKLTVLNGTIAHLLNSNISAYSVITSNLSSSNLSAMNVMSSNLTTSI